MPRSRLPDISKSDVDHPYRLIIFDFDGTLVDSQANIAACMATAFGEAGLPAPTVEAVRRIVGLSLEAAVARLVPDGQDEALVARLSAGYRQAFFARRTQPDYDEPLFPGVRATLEALNQPLVQLGIATGKNMRGLSAALAHHDLAAFFTTLQTPDTSPGKPHPGMVERAMVQSGCDRDETIVIGDTTFDIEMAKNAGVTALGVSWGYHPPEDLRAAGAAAVLGSFDALMPTLVQLGRTNS